MDLFINRRCLVLILVAPAIVINFGLSWSLPSFFRVDVIVFSVFPFCYLQLLRMMLTMFNCILGQINISRFLILSLRFHGCSEKVLLTLQH